MCLLSRLLNEIHGEASGEHSYGEPQDLTVEDSRISRSVFRHLCGLSLKGALLRGDDGVLVLGRALAGLEGDVAGV